MMQPLQRHDVADQPWLREFLAECGFKCTAPLVPPASRRRAWLNVRSLGDRPESPRLRGCRTGERGKVEEFQLTRIAGAVNGSMSEGTTPPDQIIDRFPELCTAPFRVCGITVGRAAKAAVCRAKLNPPPAKFRAHGKVGRSFGTSAPRQRGWMRLRGDGVVAVQ